MGGDRTAFLPSKPGHFGVTADQRRCVEVVLWLARTSAPWHDLPEQDGTWHSCPSAAAVGPKGLRRRRSAARKGGLTSNIPGWLLASATSPNSWRCLASGMPAMVHRVARWRRLSALIADDDFARHAIRQLLEQHGSSAGIRSKSDR